MSLLFDPLTQSFYPDHCQYHGQNLTKVHSTTIEIFRFMTTKTSSPKFRYYNPGLYGSSSSTKSWHNARIECKTTKDAPWWDEANNCGASKQLFGAVLGWISLMTFISLLQHQNVTPTIEIEPSLSQNCCWCQLQKFMVMHLSRPSAECCCA